jgi:hypothetical protein
MHEAAIKCILAGAFTLLLVETVEKSVMRKENQEDKKQA